MPDTTAWVDADGNVHALNSGGAIVMPGKEGRFMPPVQHVEDEVPLQPGSRLRQVKTLTRELTIPVYFDAATEAAHRSALRTWLGRLNVDRGDGKIRVTDSSGGVRELTCRYAGGMELSEALGVGGLLYQKSVVVFRAHDPYWYDQTDTTVTYTSASGTGATFFPFFPLVLLSSEVLASATITFSESDIAKIAAWPRWQITGPASSPVTIRNVTTGKFLKLERTLLAGERVDVDTRPGVKSVTLAADGSNLYSDLSTDSTLWNFQRGANVISVEMAGTGSGSQVVLLYKRRYLGA